MHRQSCRRELPWQEHRTAKASRIRRQFRWPSRDACPTLPEAVAVPRGGNIPSVVARDIVSQFPDSIGEQIEWKSLHLELHQILLSGIRFRRRGLLCPLRAPKYVSRFSTRQFGCINRSRCENIFCPCTVRRCRLASPPTPRSQRQRSPTVRITRAKYLGWQDSVLRCPLPPAYLQEPVIHRRTGS